jgi:hypothetical protein
LEKRAVELRRPRNRAKKIIFRRPSPQWRPNPCSDIRAGEGAGQNWVRRNVRFWRAKRASSKTPMSPGSRQARSRVPTTALLVSNAELTKVLMATVRSFSHLNIICTKGADDMSDDEWISYSHWGMFTLERKSSRQPN